MLLDILAGDIQALMLGHRWKRRHCLHCGKKAGISLIIQKVGICIYQKKSVTGLKGKKGRRTMAIRFRKYFKQCKGKRSEGDRHGKVITKGIECDGKRGRLCPENVPSPCGRWLLEFFDDHKQWVSLSFKDVRSKKDAERRLSMFIADRERGKLNLPKKKAIPTLSEYSKTYLEFYRMAKENTLSMKRRAVGALVKYLGEYPIDKISQFIIEKYRIDRKEKDKVKDSSINIDIAILSHVYTVAIKAGSMDKRPGKS